MRALALILLMMPLLSEAADVRKLQARRQEADTLVAQILAGTGVEQALGKLKYLGEEAYATEVLTEEARSVDVRKRRNIAYAMAKLGSPEAERTLVRYASDEDATVRMNAAEGLGRIRTRNLAALRPLLSDPNLGVRREAARAMGLLHTPRALKPLLIAAKSEGEPEVRAALLVSLGQSGDRKAIPTLEHFLTSSSESTRFAAAQGLCLLGAPSGHAFARKLLASKEKYERRQGLALFEGSNAKLAKPMLVPLLKDPDPSIAAAAGRILYQGGDAAMLQWLVVSAYRAKTNDKLAYEAELEPLHLADDQRKAILARAGIK